MYLLASKQNCCVSEGGDFRFRLVLQMLVKTVLLYIKEYLIMNLLLKREVCDKSNSVHLTLHLMYTLFR